MSSLVMKLGQAINLVKSNIFRKDSTWFGELGPKSKPYLIYQSTAISQKPFMMSLWFFNLLTGCNEAIKTSYHPKINRLH